jgi:hypothetical protein
MINDPTLSQVRAALDAGLTDEALNTAKARQTRDTVNPDLHLNWADILEELVLPDDVIFELNLALRDDPDRASTYERLSEVYLDQGQPQRAARVLTRLVEKQPDDPQHYEAQASALKEARQFEKAREVYETALKRTGDSRFNGFIKELSFLEKPEAAHHRVSSENLGQIEPARHNLITFTTLFASREGVYARQWVSPTGESGYTPIQEPLTVTVAENHILGNYTIGAYPVRLDNTVNYIAFDFDVAKFAVAKAISSEKLWNAVMNKVHSAACKLVDVSAANELPIYMEDSGFKGRHCWIFCERAVPAGVAKKFADLLVAQILHLPSEVTVEVFPKQTTVKRGGLGNLIKLPLGIHKRTGKRSLFIQPDGTPYEDQLNFLESVNKASRRTVYGLIQRISAGVSSPVMVEQNECDDAPPFDIGAEDRPIAPAQNYKHTYEPSYDIDSDAEFQQLMLKCPTLKSIVDKVNQTSMLSKEETLVLIHSLGHMKHGPEAVNTIFQRCMNADPSLFLKSQLKGNPISCPKIKARVPEIATHVPCDCAFDMSVNLYPTPIIHLRNMQGAGRSETPLGLTVDSLQFQNLVQDYLKLRKQLRETQLILKKYEENLRNFFEEAGVDCVETPVGQLRRQNKETGEIAFVLEI